MYVLHSTYRTLHILAPTKDVKDMWESSLRKLYSIRLGLMQDLDNHELRRTVWEAQYWKGSDTGGDRSLNLDELEAMCIRLNIDFPKGELEKLFKARRFLCFFKMQFTQKFQQEVDTTGKKSLDFPEFQHFVKLLKRRPELEALYKKLCGDQAFDYAVFEKFMKDTQKVNVFASP